MSTRTESGGRSRARRIGIGATLAALCVGLAAASPSDDGRSLTERARDTLDRWMELRSVISREKRDWTVSKEVLRDRIGLLEAELERVRERTKEAEEGISEAHRAAEEKALEDERLEAAEAVLEERVTALEALLKDLLPRLPLPIRESVRPLSQSLPDDSETTELSLSQRFQNVIGVLNLVDKFHRDVTVTTEVRTLSDGSSVEVTAMYLGVSYAFYANGSGTVGGVGKSKRAGDAGWVWSSADEHAATIQKAIAIQRGEEPAEFVLLPMQVE